MSAECALYVDGIGYIAQYDNYYDSFHEKRVDLFVKDYMESMKSLPTYSSNRAPRDSLPLPHGSDVEST